MMVASATPGPVFGISDRRVLFKLGPEFLPTGGVGGEVRTGRDQSGYRSLATTTPTVG